MLLRALLLLFAADLAFGQTGARFHRGDDLRWADPAFDDSGWELLSESRLPRLEEFKTNRLWIRTRVVVPSGERVGMVIRWCACEFYLNGRLVGSTADLSSPRPQPGPLVQNMLLPPGTPAGPALLAIRHYVPPGNDLAGTVWRLSVPSLVPIGSLASAYRDATRPTGLQVAGILLLILTAVVAALAGQGFDAVAILICTYLASAALSIFLNSGVGSDWFVRNWWARLASTAQPVLLLVVAAMLAGVRVRAWWLTSFTAAWLTVRGLWLADSLNAAPAPWAPVLIGGYLGIVAVAIGMTLRFLWAGWQRPSAPRALLVVTVLIQSLTFAGRVGSIGLPMFGTILGWDQLARLLFGVLAGAFVIRRSRERRAEEMRMKGELQAARSVQSMLLGQSMAAGVNAVYVPASEVGGDFYYSTQTPEGTVVLVGDVSGKGLQAAMTVSAILGILRTVEIWEPDQVLSKLNSALVGNAGFVTCCCVLVSRGEVLVANAGHPAPYFDGAECAGESGLPLGVSAEASWEVSAHPRPSVITLISDGVVEATNEAGELFGFERTLAISRKPAKEIAQAAQAWGQEDDITVVTVR